MKDVSRLILKVLSSHCVVKHNVKKREYMYDAERETNQGIQELVCIFAFEGEGVTTADIRVNIGQMINPRDQVWYQHQGRKRLAEEWPRRRWGTSSGNRLSSDSSPSSKS